MYRLAKNGINTRLFKAENNANMEWIYEFFEENYLKNAYNLDLLWKQK